jgi:hypothetical protein
MQLYGHAQHKLKSTPSWEKDSVTPSWEKDSVKVIMRIIMWVMWNWAAWPSLEQLRPTTPAMPMPYSLKHSHIRPLSSSYCLLRSNSLVVILLLDPVPVLITNSHYYYRNYNYNYKWRLILLIVSSSPSSMTRHPPLRLQWPISCLVYTFLHSPLSIHLLYYFPTPPTSAATTTTTSTTIILLLLSSRPIRSPVLLHTSPRLCRDPTPRHP